MRVLAELCDTTLSLCITKSQYSSLGITIYFRYQYLLLHALLIYVYDTLQYRLLQFSNLTDFSTHSVTLCVSIALLVFLLC